jgi:hypothetical protein
MPSHDFQSPVCAASCPCFLVGTLSASALWNWPRSTLPLLPFSINRRFPFLSLFFTCLLTSVHSHHPIGWTGLPCPRRRLASGTSGTHAWVAAKASLGITSSFNASFLTQGAPSTIEPGATLAGPLTTLDVFLWARPLLANARTAKLCAFPASALGLTSFVKPVRSER